MFFLRLFPYSVLFVIAANAESSSGSRSSSRSSSDGKLVLSGPTAATSEAATPTGPYETYSSTITITTPSAITTEVIVSTIVGGSSTITTTIGSIIIFGISFTSSVSATVGATTTTHTQLIIQGSIQSTTTPSGTSNSAATSTSSAAKAINTTPCNNYPEFCSRKYSSITEVSAHNSPFVKIDNAASNQALAVTTQLDDGIRLVQGQMHFVNSTPHFCHTSCDILDMGPITEYLSEVYSWVSKHPYDVVTILLENGDFSPVTSYVPFIESTGLVSYAYLPPKIPMGIDDWPTLSSMILTGKRVVFFMDYDANQTAVPWMLDEFSQMFETPFDPTDRSFPCNAQRPPNLSNEAAKNLMYLTNHNLNYDINILGDSLLVPDLPLLNVTNNVTGFGSLGEGAETCYSDWGVAPKWLNVDYYDVGSGSVFEVAAKYNNVTYNRPCCGIVASGAERTRQNVALLAAVVGGVSWLLLL